MKKEKGEAKAKREVEMVLKCADLIKDSVKVAYSLQKLSGMETCDVITSSVLAMGDMILAFSDASGEPREKVLKMFVICLKDHVRNADKPTAKEVKM